MRIKTLELTGFKSFPQRTTIELPTGVSGIVGPNGCGKSNLVDAIRWVLGEQSPKHLRGDAMEAVVFNGNERMAPLGMAEVSLTFENDSPPPVLTDLDLEVSSIPAHFRDLSEIMITRRYFRSGESEYFINKTACRLKDITELFLGTGVGSKAYAIIEQGRVEQLINAKPEDRRLFIEEAAGTTLYRSRKLAAERKMERARENLARVNDILREIDRQVQYLQRQAKKAEAYKQLTTEVRELEIRCSAHQWQALDAERRQHEEALGQLAAEEQRIRAALQSCETAEALATETVGEAEGRQVAIRERLAVLDAERESLRERLAMFTQEREERERRRARLSEELEVTRRAQHEAETAGRLAATERDASAQSLVLEEEQLAGGEAALGEARTALAEAQARLESAKGGLVGHITREAEARNALSALVRRREDIARQRDKLHQEEAAVQAQLAEIDRQSLERRAGVEQLRAQLDATAGEQEARAHELRSLAEQKRGAERVAGDVEAALLQVQSRLESLEQIQLNYEGFHRGVRAIMREEQHANGVLGVVADVIDIPERYERAVAAVLGERLQYVIVRGEQEGVGAVDLLRREASGRGSFIPLHPRQLSMGGAASLNGSSVRLLDVVGVKDSFRPVAESLLGEVVLVPDLDAAVNIWRQNGIYVTLVTPEGDVMDPSGVITGGSDRPIEEEILARRREIEGLRVALESKISELAIARTELSHLDETIVRVDATVKDLGQNVHDLTVRLVGVEKDLERLEIERPQCVSRSQVIRYELGSLAAEDEQAAAEASAVEARVAAAIEERESRQREVAEEQRSAEDIVGRVDALAEEVTSRKVRVAERRERQQAAAVAAESWRRQQAELAARETALSDECGNSQRERDKLDESIAMTRRQEEEQVERRGQLERDAQQIGAETEERRNALRGAEEATRATHEKLESLRDRRAQVELARSEVRLRAEHLAQTIHEKYEVELAAQESIDAEGEELAESASRLEALKQRLSRLGEVNVAAIDELRELEERGGFLRTQRDDLDRSLSDLERTIQKLNRASRTRFAETFARANETFQKVFPRLFRGGEGRLVLTDEHNLLETGVEIIVRPPGKRLDTVALLSGGEKALVAVSLIFSLFLINPTPFCILDEVDAPLDDANVSRFNQLVREMSEHSQFILITHNKRTMEAASALYGITMQEPGVSKVISVNLS
jgi:chromosome segregation protein